MHGRPRKAPKAEDAAASAAESANVRHLQAQLLHHHHHQIYTKEALLECSKLLQINPEIYTAWNYRKLAVQHNLLHVTDAESVRLVVDEELRVVEAALRQNPKAYGPWYHRKWMLRHGFSENDYNREFGLLARLLKLDPRNFHGWNYRRFLAALKNVPELEELKFTTDMIDTNFSNYSAWHSRSLLLSHLLKQKAQGFESKENILAEEYELVHQALFTDENDQSGWFYHLWLVDQTVSLDDPLLISAWPSNESDWVLFGGGDTDYWRLCPSKSTTSYYSLHKGLFPIVLYFNQLVTGINTSTITVNSTIIKNKDLIWRPLPNTASGSAHCWVAYINLSDAKYSGEKAFSVEVSLGQSVGIVSSRGSSYNRTFQFKFTIELSSLDSEHTQEKTAEELFVWNDDNTCHPQEKCLVSFDQLSITDSHERVASNWHMETLSNEIDLFKESPEINSKFIKLTLARLLFAYDAMLAGEVPSKQKRIHSEEVLKLLDDLIWLDPSHAKFYEDQRSLVLIDQVTFDKDLLVKHCRHFNKPTSSDLNSNPCLQLKSLSLTRLGFAERFLWVLMLDLSHNKLQSIEGLEALQLLTYLNISNNRICSFTALEPLKWINSLRVLDVSFNEIGSHLIDTRRYLCSSPISHSMNLDSDIEGLQNDNIKVVDLWEAIVVFKGLPLTQLHVMGNEVADENLRALLIKLLPNLLWLDGTCIQ